MYNHKFQKITNTIRKLAEKEKKNFPLLDEPMWKSVVKQLGNGVLKLLVKIQDKNIGTSEYLMNTSSFLYDFAKKELENRRAEK